MLCTSYNLAKCMQMFEIVPLPQAASQLLLWIQDGLDQLKDMPDAEPDKKMAMGDVTVFEGSTKIGSRDIEVTEAELILEGN
jgi:hypothetical protein